MYQGAQFLAIAAIISFLILGPLSSCSVQLGDPGSELTLQIYNKTERPIRVMLVTAWRQREPTREETWFDVAVDPREMKEVNQVLGMGAQLGPILAYADGQLVFCQNYRFPVDAHSKETRSVEVVENQIACE